MPWKRLTRLIICVNVIAVFALGAWLRVTSLNLPAVGGDEAFFGVQTARILHGKGPEWLTPSLRPINVFVIGSQAPLYALFGPSWVTIKAPAAMAGLLTLVATWLVLRKRADRTSAIIATTLAAVTPVLIVESRIGMEAPWIPLAGTIGLGAALSGRVSRAIVAFLVCYYVHPTFLFLLPVLGLPLAGRILVEEANWRLAARRVAIAGVVFAIVVAPLAILARSTSTMAWTYATYGFGPANWGKFLIGFERLFLGFCESGSWETSKGLDIAFWTILTLIAVPGTFLLARRKRWDRLGLVAGFPITMAGFHLMTGPEIMSPNLTRYGLFLVPASVFALAFLLSEFVPTGSSRVAESARWSLSLAGLAAAWSLLFVVKHSTFDPMVANAQGTESLATIETETPDPREWVAAIVREDRRSDWPLAVAAEDWWTFRPLEFWLSDLAAARVSSLEYVAVQTRDQRILEHLERGGYVVATVGQPESERVKALVPGEKLRHWHVSVPPNPCLVLYRLKRAGEKEGIDPIVLLKPDEAALR
jgi:hypothetical protein